MSNIPCFMWFHVWQVVSPKLQKQTITFVAHSLAIMTTSRKKNRVFLFISKTPSQLQPTSTKRSTHSPVSKVCFFLWIPKQMDPLKNGSPRPPTWARKTAQLPHLVFARTALCQPLGNGGNELRGQTSREKFGCKKPLSPWDWVFCSKLRTSLHLQKKIGLHGFESGWVCRNRHPNWLKNVVTIIEYDK